jgi:glycosyltransferase involved in cell wall biosynthesis
MYSPNGEPIILNVARIASFKNQLTIAKAVPLVLDRFPKAQFLFVGPYPGSSTYSYFLDWGAKDYFKQVQHVIKQNKVSENVHFLGEIPYADLPKLYQLGTVFVCPSAYEAFGLVVIEAMAMGKAIVASRIETFTEMLRNERGVTVPTFDHYALANAIVYLLENDSLREEMGQRAQRYTRTNYTWTDVAIQTSRVYQDLQLRARGKRQKRIP